MKTATSFRRYARLVALVLLIGTFSASMFAQSVTGQISGTVADASGAVIPGAKVEITNAVTQQVRTVNTDSSGNFIFSDVVPGTYAVRITQSGFQSYTPTDVALATSERLSLHQITLQVGNVATEVSVVGTAARVETDSSARGLLVTSSQVSEIPNKGRNFKDYFNVLPGATGNVFGTDAPGWNNGNVFFNGGAS